MAVTREVYTAAATWTASGLATLFRDAFIDAGLMTDWHASFLNTVENRVLAVAYDATKTYGTAYYWFQFTTTGVFVHVATGWNTSTNVPTGTQYVDFFATTTNSTANHKQLITLSASTSVTLTRYTSGVNTDHSWFLIRNGTSNTNLHIPDAGVPKVSWLDLDLVHFSPLITAATGLNITSGEVGFRYNNGLVRRSYIGQHLRGTTANNNYTEYSPRSFNYSGHGNLNANSVSNSGAADARVISVPVGFNNTNPGYATNSIPVFSGAAYHAYLSESLPSDFGVSFHYANNTMTVQDKLIVTAASEEWEMLAVTNSSSATGERPSPMFLARVV